MFQYVVDDARTGTQGSIVPLLLATILLVAKMLVVSPLVPFP